MNCKYLSTLATVVLAGQLLSLKAATTYTFQDGLNGYAGTHDAQLRGATPDRDDGALGSLSIDGSDGGSENHVVLRFENLSGTGANQVPPKSTVILARLRLYIVSEGNPPNLHRMLRPWTESITWYSHDQNNDGLTADGVEAALEPDLSFEAPSGTPYSTDITLPVKTIQDWLDGKSPNYGWAFLPTGSNGVDFNSSENSTVDTRPKLTIVVGAPGEPFINTVSPLNGATEVPSTTPIEFTVTEGSLKVNPASVVLTVNGETVKHTLTKSADTSDVKISYTAPSPLPAGATVTAKLVFADTASPPHVATQEISFVTKPITAPIFAISESQIWSYEASGTDLGTAWREKAFNDTAWLSGPGLLGFETGAMPEPLRTPFERGPMTFYFRTKFSFNGDPAAVRLRLRHVIDDGGVFYLNGVEVHRFAMPQGDVTFETGSTGHENRYEGPFEISAASLVRGENVLAVEVHQSDAGSSDLVFGAELESIISSPPAATTAKFNSIKRSGQAIVLEWAGLGALQAADAITGPWTEVQNAKSPLTVTPAGAGKFYRLRP